MRDPQHRRAVFLPQHPYLGQDLRLNRYVERGGGLVGNHQIGLVQHGNGNHHALPHAARELVRKRR